MNRIKHPNLQTARGITLVELMVTIAIVGILAAIGSIAYGRYITTGKITKLKATATEVASGQERYRSRNNKYLAPGGDFATVPAKYQNLLDFAGGNLPPDVIVTTDAWTATQACGVCTTEGIPFDNTQDGFVVVVKQDLDPSDPNDTTVWVTRTVQSPVLKNEGG